jgi:hypothetical protein
MATAPPFVTERRLSRAVAVKSDCANGSQGDS